MARNYYSTKFEEEDEENRFDSVKTALADFHQCVKSQFMAKRKGVVRVVMDIFQLCPGDVLLKELPDLIQGLTDVADAYRLYIDAWNVNTSTKLYSADDLLDQHDESMLSHHVLEHIPHIITKAKECSEKCPELKDLVSENLLPVVVKNLGTHDTGIDKTAQKVIIWYIKQNLLNKAQVEIKICPSILAHSNSDIPDVITGSIMLMSKLAPYLGRDVVERVFLNRFTELCEHNQFIVRKFCASHMGDFGAVIGKDSFERVLLTRYLRLCSDQIWSVRKSAAAVVMFVSCSCYPETRKWTLAPIFLPLLKDECKWVKRAAYNSLGPFISTFASPSIINMTINSDGDLVLINNDGIEFLMDLADEKTPSIFEKIPPDDASILFEEISQPKQPVDMDIEDIGDIGEQPPPPPPPDNESPTTTNVALKSDDIKEMVETIKNVVFSYRVDNLTNGNVIQNECKSCDSLDNVVEDNVVVNKDVNRNIDEKIIKNGNYKIPEIKSEDVDNEDANQVNKSETETEDDLHLFNSYNYWYIQPELPLDPDLIKDLPRTENGAGDLTSNLEDIYSNVNLSDSFNEDCLDKSRLLDNWDDTNSLTNSTAEEVIPEVEVKPTQDIVPQTLIDHYISMTEQTLARDLDCDVSFRCAYSLPAVVLTLGNENWELIKTTVERLSVDMQYRVRKEVASCLHELAIILGPEVATDDLTPIFDGFLKDLDEVKIGVLKHLAQFLTSINVNTRNLYLPRLEEFLKTDNESNWRFKEELGNQLILALPLFRPADTGKFIGKIAQELLCDKVYGVREVAISLIIEIIKCVSKEAGMLPHLLIKLAEKLAHSKIWKRRQTYALLCLELVRKKAVPNDLFASEVLPHLLDLSWDPVANVRLVVARILSQHIVLDDYFSNKKSEHADGLEIVLKRLRADKDRDVREAAGEFDPPKPAYAEFNQMLC